MNYFDNEKNVFEYIKMVDGYDGKLLIEILTKHLKSGSSLLELGMGPGKDLDILKNDYNVTGSDSSKVFIDLYKKNNPDSNLLLLDAITIDTDNKFDCIYSNKVLHHLKKDNLVKSIIRQKEVLNKNGIAFHSFWKGDKTETFNGLFFQYYLEKDLQSLVLPYFEIMKISIYSEMDTDDSILLILKNSKKTT